MPQDKLMSHESVNYLIQLASFLPTPRTGDRTGRWKHRDAAIGQWMWNMPSIMDCFHLASDNYSCASLYHLGWLLPSKKRYTATVWYSQ